MSIGFHAMCVVRSVYHCLSINCTSSYLCFAVCGLGGLVATRLIQTEHICTLWLNPGWFPMKYVELYKDVLNSVVV